jgi:hypothetical protein
MLSAVPHVNGPPFPTTAHVVTEGLVPGIITAKLVVEPV